ncbi:MAG: TlpA family protein disulfide reductase [Chloroflexi bacterium]|nr:TlpA family protein disulfide reductase [Chloroflexota bacterium]
MRLVRWRAAGSRSSGRLLIILGINALGLVAAIGILLYALTRPLTGIPVEGVTLDGEALLQEQAAAAGRAVRDPAPGLAQSGGGVSPRLADLEGRSVTLADYRGRPIWITFWATYCHACQLEEPDLRRVYASHVGDDLVMLAIDVGEDRAVVRRYVEERRLPWTVLIDVEGSAVGAYGAIGTPTHYFVDRQGIIRSRAFGALAQDEMEAHLAGIE